MSARINSTSIKDARALQDALERNARQTNDSQEGDIVIEMPRRLFLRDTNGIYWQISVSTAGVLTTTSVGAVLP